MTKTRRRRLSLSIIITAGLWVLMGLAYLVTLRRPVPDMAARAPAVAVACAETLLMIGYAIVAQIAGVFLGHAVSGYAISLPMPGTLYGLSGPYTLQAAIYNFVVYAVLPFAYFRWRGYMSLTEFNGRLGHIIRFADYFRNGIFRSKSSFGQWLRVGS